jgi:hypothetical protein
MKQGKFLMSTASILFVLSTSIGWAQDKGFGLGVILGEPTGVSGKSWISQRTAIDGGLAWSFRGAGSVHIHADHLWHFLGVPEASERFSVYVGVGGRIATLDESVLGVRFPVGLVWWPKDAPLDVFVEFVPILDLAPASEFDANGGIGVRYFFQ